MATFWADGSCDNKTGCGGWGFCRVRENNPVITHEQWGSATGTTNNRMELLAVIRAVQSVKRKNQVIRVYSDSRYVVNSISQWLRGWQAKGFWAKGRPTPNADLWKEYLDAQMGHRVEMYWVKGHAGHEYNERADRLADLGFQEAKSKVSK